MDNTKPECQAVKYEKKKNPRIFLLMEDIEDSAISDIFVEAFANARAKADLYEGISKVDIDWYLDNITLTGSTVRELKEAGFKLPKLRSK
jgi:hypothetical protein